MSSLIRHRTYNSDGQHIEEEDNISREPKRIAKKYKKTTPLSTSTTLPMIIPELPVKLSCDEVSINFLHKKKTKTSKPTNKWRERSSKASEVTDKGRIFKTKQKHTDK